MYHPGYNEEFPKTSYFQKGKIMGFFMLGNKHPLNPDVFILIENFRKYNEKGMA